MPSFRVTLAIAGARPGVPPQSVLPAAAEAAREFTTVEATDMSVVSGAPRIIVRFTADNPDAAATIASTVASRVAELAHVTSGIVTRRVGGRWEPTGRV